MSSLRGLTRILAHMGLSPRRNKMNITLRSYSSSKSSLNDKSRDTTNISSSLRTQKQNRSVLASNMYISTKNSTRYFSTATSSESFPPSRAQMEAMREDVVRLSTNARLARLRLSVPASASPSMKSTQKTSQWEVHGAPVGLKKIPLSSEPSPPSVLHIPGLFGILGLHQPADFERIVQEQLVAVKECAQKLHDTSLDASAILLLVDELSTHLCDITDVLEFCRNVHEDEVWRNAAHETWVRMQEIFGIFSTDKHIAAAIARVTNDKAIFSTLSTEERRILDSMNIRLNGFSEVSDIAIKHSLHLNEFSFQLDRQYHSNLEHYSFLTLTNTRARSILNHASDLRESVKQVGSNTVVRLDQYTTSTILSNVPSREIRHAIYLASLKVNQANLLILAKFIAAKQAASQVIGYRSFTHNSLLTEVARSPENVVRFLEAFRRYVSPLARKDLLQLRDRAEKAPRGTTAKVKRGVDSIFGKLLSMTKTKADEAMVDGDEGEASESRLTRLGRLGPRKEVGSPYEHGLEAWDVFYARTLASELSANEDDNSVYFSYAVCLDALQTLSRDVFGLELIPSPMRPADLSVGENTENWAEATTVEGLERIAITKFELCDMESQEHIGSIYMDPFNRPGKVQGAATFTLRCSKEMTPASMPLATGETSDLPYRKSVVALVANFQPEYAPVNVENPTMQASSMELLVSQKYPHLIEHLTPKERQKWEEQERMDLANSRSLLLSHGRFMTILHEYGHALNALLSRTKYQIISGVRYELDFVETPSTFMENFATEPEFLRKVSKHYLTGMPIPEKIIAGIIANVNAERALTILDTARTAAIDQRLYGVPSGYDKANPFPWVTTSVEASASESGILPLEDMLAEVEAANVQYISSHNPREEKRKSSDNTPDYTQVEFCGVIDLNEPRWAYLQGKEGLEVVNQIFNRYSVTPPLEELVSPQASTSHLMNYSGSYYTYVYCETFSRAVYNKLFSAGPFNKEAGALFRKHLLSTGGSNYPLTNLARVLGVKNALETEELSVEQQNELFNDVMKNYIAFLNQKSKL